ncbi:MAG: Ig-like domain-containing protein, partial [Bacteroidota bacterium]
MQLITRTICTWLCLLSTILVLGQGAYDLQFVVSTLDCVNDRLCIDIQIRAQDPTNEFLLTNQNYRFTFSSNLANPVIDTELTLSGFVIEMGIPSLWDPHDLTGSVGNLVSYNVQLAGGTGYPLNSTNWLSIGRVCFDIVSNTPEDCFQITWNEPALDFPPTVILGNDVLGLPIVPAYITSSSVGTTCDGSVCSLPPVAVNDTLSVVENNVLMGDVSPNDFEPDGETMTWSTTPVSGPSNGSILINPDGTFTYTPNPGFNGMDTVAYQVCDQTIPPFCDTALILITVLPCSNFAQINPTTALCAPQATFTATDVGMMATYDWDFGPLSTPGTASGIGPHNISFSSGGSQDITLTVTIGSCVDQITVPVDVVSNLMANPIIQDVTCQGFNDGQVDLNVSGGTGPYTFIWTNSATTEVITGLMPGGYNVIIRDLNNCFATASVSISDPPLFGSSIFSSQGVLCNGEASGIALATPNGGVSPYTFLWDNGETTAQATMLSGGFHSVTVTDANTCEVINTVNVTEAPVFSVTASVDQDVSCNGFLDGIATVNPSGGTGLFTFLWDNNETTAQATMLSGGLHVVTVTDENTCVQTTQVNLAEPTAILSGIFLVQDVQCNGEATGSATVSPSGGLGPYTFLWSSGETEATATQLSVGNQLITITDNLGCSTVETIVLSEPPTLQLTTSVDNDLLCFGDLDGAATAMPSGGTGAYTFLWDN